MFPFSSEGFMWEETEANPAERDRRRLPDRSGHEPVDLRTTLPGELVARCSWLHGQQT